MKMSFSTKFLPLFSLLTLVPFASAHGYLKQVVIDGQVYGGNTPNNYAFASAIRLIDNVEPVKGSDNPNLSCGQDAARAELVAAANPGSNVSFSWVGGDDSHWPHNIGPLLTYMAACTGTTCDKFDASQAQWFKIDQIGKEKGSDTWVQQRFLDGDSYTLTLPQNIAPGDYLIRHEILALHLGNEPGGAEFYPACTQVRIGGNGNGVPNSTVPFPGAYSDNDPGILVPQVFDSGFAYTAFPGPPVSDLISNDNGASQNAASAPPASPAGGYGSGCQMKRMVKRHKRTSGAY